MAHTLDPTLTLPPKLLPLWPVAKMLWVYLNLTGPLVVSQRELSVTLGITQRPVALNLKRLGEEGLITYEPGTDRAAKSQMEAVDPLFSPVDGPLPGILKEADASAKLLYLWLLPQGTVPYTHKEVSGYLGITEMTAVKTRQALESYGAISYERRPSPRKHGIYYVLKANELEQRLDAELALPDAIERGKGAELKLYLLIEQRGEVEARQETLAEHLDIPQSAISKALKSLLEKGLIRRRKQEGQTVLVLAQQRASEQPFTGEASLPKVLEGEANAVQLLYMWLKPQGDVQYSYSDMVELVRIRSYSVMKAVQRLEELGLLEVSEKPSPHSKGRLRITE